MLLGREGYAAQQQQQLGQLAAQAAGSAATTGCNGLQRLEARNSGTGACPSVPRLCNPVAARLLGAFNRSFGDDSMEESLEDSLEQSAEHSGFGEGIEVEAEDGGAAAFSSIAHGRVLADVAPAAAAVVVVPTSRRAVLL